MATIRFPPDFLEFLRLLNSKGVEYLIVRGYAVGFHGYPRATADLDIWIAGSPSNAKNVEAAVREFGFDVPELSPELFLAEDRVVRMGEPPIRIEILTNLSGIEFRRSFQSREVSEVEGVQLNFLGLDDLKANKKAAGRHQDLSDLEHLS